MSRLLAHGLGTEPVAPDWPPLTDAEVGDVLGGGPVRVLWRSPRPLSAAALVESERLLFVKRHHVSVRTEEGLAEEHAFLRHLRERGAPVVDVLSVVRLGEWVYEVHTAGTGTDLYQDALSWSPFASAGHAGAAGAVLARLHLAAEGYRAPHRQVQPLVASFTVFASADPAAALERYVARRPALAAALADQPWRTDTERVHLPLHRRLAPLLDDLEPLWTHNDWHASNLLWDVAGSEAAAVTTVLDFGLSDRTTAVHDLATAIERNIVQWLDLPSGSVRVQLDHLDALLRGYTSVRPLSAAESAALPELLPLVHAEFALSELDYFHGVTGSAASSALAYDYYLGHAEWFTTPDGRGLLEHLRREAR
ncbi:phosphotransferase enzyme family protein [Actinacidiphila oryziradicis]|uniref:Aminoglycoside phosphotransferase family protein n=1 Tax=Actinacidiphila oryziradicis TaxID=2571141 RepID=A0A4U0RD16_9ACTN|nr:phosphotransferase [Actinacidiphila oryziradicis]TJZ93115.1 aminoglycoside phosphotransferase family protein [Actinacidiphila oryziradicis]